MTTSRHERFQLVRQGGFTIERNYFLAGHRLHVLPNFRAAIAVYFIRK